jgi:hypothetical protein
MIKDGRLPDGCGLVCSKKCGKLVSSEGSQGYAKESEDACDLSGKLHKAAMMVAAPQLFNFAQHGEPAHGNSSG